MAKHRCRMVQLLEKFQMTADIFHKHKCKQIALDKNGISRYVVEEEMMLTLSSSNLSQAP